MQKQQQADENNKKKQLKSDQKTLQRIKISEGNHKSLNKQIPCFYYLNQVESEERSKIKVTLLLNTENCIDFEKVLEKNNYGTTSKKT